MKIFYMPEGVPAGTTVDDLVDQNADPVPPKQTPPESKPEAPAWFSQLPKEMREDKDTADVLGKFKNISDLVKVHLESVKKSERMLEIPDKESTPEQIKAFFAKMGVPETSEGYELSDFDLDKDAIAQTKSIFAQAAHKSALTKKQAQNMWKSEVALAKAIGQMQEAEGKKQIESFEPQYNALLEGEYPDEHTRSKAITGELSVVKRWIQDMGIGKEMKESGLVYNAKVMHAIARYVSKNLPAMVKGEPDPKTQDKVGRLGNYSEQFLKAAGR